MAGDRSQDKNENNMRKNASGPKLPGRRNFRSRRKLSPPLRGDDDFNWGKVVRVVLSWVAIITAVFLVMTLFRGTEGQEYEVTFTQYQIFLRNNEIDEATIKKSELNNYDFHGVLKRQEQITTSSGKQVPGKRFSLTLPYLDDKVVDDWNARGIRFNIVKEESTWVSVLVPMLPWVLLLGIWFSLTDKMVGQSPRFIGLGNFTHLAGDPIFQRTLVNTLLYAGITVSCKLVLGMAMALLMNQVIPLRKLIRAALLLPWIVPTALSTLAWLWIFDPTYSVINWVIVHLGIGGKINWLGDSILAMAAVMIVNVWRGVPFMAITLLAGLQMLSPEPAEAASIDGASTAQRFWYITLPLLSPVLLPLVLLSLIWTLSDFQLVYILTRGGPANSTHILGTLAYQQALPSAQLGEGSAIALSLFPFLLAIIVFMLRRSREGTA
jgi:multiple sugar transport system permease protein